VPPAAREEIREKLGLKKDQPVILGVFRFVTPKRPLDFIRVVGVLRQQHQNLRAILCGDGPLMGEMRELIRQLDLEKTVTLAGVVEDVPAMMSAATLLLHTAEIEGSPNVILEAQAAGLPIVCVENGGVLQFLAQDWRRFMKKQGDVEGLAASCAYLIDHPEERLESAAQAQAETATETSLETLAQKTLNAATVTTRKP
jgi:glycosyltransferase involved in cell wall biosynthesis